MLYGYLSCVYTDLVSLPLSAEMTAERSLHSPATILRHHITVLTVQVTEQHLGCYWATMEEATVTCEGITYTYENLVWEYLATWLKELLPLLLLQRLQLTIGSKYTGGRLDKNLNFKKKFWATGFKPLWLIVFFYSCNKQHCFQSQQIKGFIGSHVPPPRPIILATWRNARLAYCPMKFSSLEEGRRKICLSIFHYSAWARLY